MSLNRNHLALFQAVAEEGSFGRGARRMHVSQPAVSKQVAQLEDAVGLKLLDRLPRGVRLTAAGQTLLAYAQRISETEQQAQFALDQHRGLKAGHLAIGASTTIGVYLLPEVLGSFHRQYPGIELHLKIANTRTIQQQLARHHLDLGLTEGLLGDSADPAVTADVFHEDELVLIAPPDHPLCLNRRVTARHLTQYPLLMREPGSGTRAVIEKALAQRRLTIEPRMSIGSTEAIKRAVAAGMGIAIVSRLTVALELALGRLTIVAVKDLDLRRPLHRLRSVTASDNAVVTAFSQTLDQTLAQSAVLPRPAAQQTLSWSI